MVERLRPATLDEDVRAAFARSPPHAKDKLPGKIPYYAPEVRSRAGPRCASASSRPRSVQLLSGEPYYADRVDVWCVGIMLCSMLTGSYPWEGGCWRVGLPYYQTIVSPLEGTFRRLLQRLGAEVTVGTANLITRMLARDSLARPTAAVLLAELSAAAPG